jgi:hypothetical protein
MALPAHADPYRVPEGYTYESFLGVASGIEGGDAGTSRIGWQRARFRINGGVDLRDEEDALQGFGFRAAVELERRASLGGEVRYSRWLGRAFGGYAGISGVVAPETLLGGTAGCTLLLPLGPRGGLFLEPSLSVFPLGSDLPENSLLIWGLLTLGVNVRL